MAKKRLDKDMIKSVSGGEVRLDMDSGFYQVVDEFGRSVDDILYKTKEEAENAAIDKSYEKSFLKEGDIWRLHGSIMNR